MRKLYDFLSKPRSALTFWALCHLTAWTLIPLICNTCLPLDSTEAVMWGSQWQWGYDKHPPLSAWAAELSATLGGDGGVYLLSQLCVVIAGLGIYHVGRRLGLGAFQALLSVLLLDTVAYFNFVSVEFNVNILQMPFWAWGWFFGLDAVQNKRAGSWLGLGACVALGALTKYLAVLMLIPLFAAWTARGELKQALRSPGLYAAGLVSLLIFLPHFLWMKDHNWMTLTYGLHRTADDQSGWWLHLWNPVDFLLEQAGVLLPLILTAALCRFRLSAPPENIPGSFALSWSALVFLTVLSMLTAMSLVTVWAAPLCLAAGLWTVPSFRMDQRPKTVLCAVIAMSTVCLCAYGIVYGLGPLIREKPHRVNYPGPALAQAVEARWHQVHDRPLRCLIADEFLGGIVNRYGKDRPAIMIRGSLERSAYLSEEQVRRGGAAVLWLKARDALNGQTVPLEAVFPDLAERYPRLQIGPDLVIPWPRRHDGKAGCYGVAYIPPEKE